MIYKVKSFVIGIKNLIYFFNCIWRFRSWDYSYIYPILKVCLTKLKKAKELDSEIEEDKIVKLSDMQYCIDILDRLNTPFVYDDIAECEVGTESSIKVHKRAEELEDFEFDDLFDTLKINLRSWWV